jgi:hypothetical protein
MSYLCRQRGPPPASCTGLQSRQFHANPGDAKDDGAVVADQPAREVDQDRRQGRQPRSLRHFPAGRGRGVATDVRRHPVADRPAPDATRAGMTGAWSNLRQATAAEEVHLAAANRRVYPLGAVGRLLSTDCCGPDARFTVVETPRKGDPGSQPPGIVGTSVLTHV